MIPFKSHHHCWDVSIRADDDFKYLYTYWHYPLGLFVEKVPLISMSVVLSLSKPVPFSEVLYCEALQMMTPGIAADNNCSVKQLCPQ